MKREEILVNPKVFSENLDQMFGLGTRAVKSSIVREIKVEILQDTARSSSDESLVETMKQARSHLQRLEAGD